MSVWRRAAACACVKGNEYGTSAQAFCLHKCPYPTVERPIGSGEGLATKPSNSFIKLTVAVLIGGILQEGGGGDGFGGVGLVGEGLGGEGIDGEEEDVWDWDMNEDSGVEEDGNMEDEDEGAGRQHSKSGGPAQRPFPNESGRRFWLNDDQGKRTRNNVTGSASASKTTAAATTAGRFRAAHDLVRLAIIRLGVGLSSSAITVYLDQVDTRGATSTAGTIEGGARKPCEGEEEG